MNEIVKNNENFYTRLRQARIKRGLSQAELGQKLGFKGNTAVYRFEAGKSSPPIKTLLKIAEVLNVDLHWLITGQVPAAIKRLKPFAQVHLAEKEQEIQALRGGQSNLLISEITGRVDAIEVIKIKEEIENLKMYCKAIRDSLNEVLAPFGERI